MQLPRLSLGQDFTIIDLENDYFLVRFRTVDDAYLALTLVQFNSSNSKIDYTIACLRLPGMPLHYYHNIILRLLGQVIGTVLKIDYNTKSTSRGKFARIAIEINLTNP